MKIKLTDLLPNPYRNIDNYPIRKDKMAALMKSIKDTGFWDNIVAREHPTKEGKFEIAYGHHRLKALEKLAQKAPKKYSEIDIPVRDLSNETMLKMMASENMSEWDPDAVIYRETVLAVKKAHENNELDVFRTKQSLSVRDIEKFLGWPLTRVHDALKQIEAIDEGVVHEEYFIDMSPRTAGDFAGGALDAKKRAQARGRSPSEAKKSARSVAEFVHAKYKRGLSHKAVREEFRHYYSPESEDPPEIDHFIDNQVRELMQLFCLGGRMPTKPNRQLADIAEHFHHATPERRERLIGNLAGLEKRITAYRSKLESHEQPKRDITPESTQRQIGKQ